MIVCRIGFGIVHSPLIRCFSSPVSITLIFVKVSKRSRTLLVCSDGKGRLWSTETGAIAKEYVGHQKPATCLAFEDRTYR